MTRKGAALDAVQRQKRALPWHGEDVHRSQNELLVGPSDTKLRPVVDGQQTKNGEVRSQKAGKKKAGKKKDAD